MDEKEYLRYKDWNCEHRALSLAVATFELVRCSSDVTDAQGLA